MFYSFETIVYRQGMSSLQVFVEPVEHVSKSLFSGSYGERVAGIISASKSMLGSWKDLGEVWNLQEQEIMSDTLTVIGIRC